MTLLEDRPTSTDEAAQRPHHTRSTLPTTSWRFAARLARREVRRRPGRTVLVMLLIALPVLGMTVGSIIVRTDAQNDAGAFAREFGMADLVLVDRDQFRFDVDGTQFADGNELGTDGLPGFPTETVRLDYIQVWSAIQGTSDTGERAVEYVQFTGVDPTDPIADGMYVVDRGALPSSAGEVLLSPDVADAFDVDVGDTLRLDVPDLDLTVTAIGRSAAWLSSSVVVVPDFDPDLVQPERRIETTLVDLPNDATDAELASIVLGYRQGDFDAQTAVDRGYDNGNVRTEQLAWGWVAGAVAFIAVGIVIAAAFATSARRQLATVGQLAANGASERLIQRTLGLQGMWTAALGAVVGVALGIAGVFAARSFGLVDQLAGYRSGGLVVRPHDLLVVALTALLAGTIAARVPARSAARIPVLSALAGRRPIARPPKWLVPVGIGLFGFGLFLLAAVASVQGGGNFAVAMAVLGALGVLFGIVCCSPLMVAWIGTVGSRRGGVVRLASRSLGRSRMRSAGVLTAIATVATVAIVGLTVAGSARDLDESQNTVDYSLVAMNYWDAEPYPTDEFGNVDLDYDPPPTEVAPVPADLRNSIEQIVPDAVWYPITSVTFDQPSDRTYQRLLRPIVSPVVADAGVVELLGLDAEQQATLAEQGTLSMAPYIGGEVDISSPAGLTTVDFGEPADSYPSGQVGDALISPEYVAELGLGTQVGAIIVDNPNDLTDEQRDALNAAQPGDIDSAFVGASSSSEGTSGWYAYASRPSFDVPWPLVQAAVLGASLLMVLLVVAIGLSLAATESRDERDVLHVVGAPPRTLRRVAAAKAWVLATGAAVVAVPAGYIVVRVITWASDNTAPFPVAGAIGILVIIPAVAWAATLAVSAIAQRSRPITVSTLTLD